MGSIRKVNDLFLRWFETRGGYGERGEIWVLPLGKPLGYVGEYEMGCRWYGFELGVNR